MSIRSRLARSSIPEPNSGCLLWADACTEGGYAELWWQGEVRYGHHLAYEAKTGQRPPKGLVIRHKCGVRCCVEETHVLDGTYQDNADDTVAMGRSPKGERNAHAKLTVDQIRAIRADTRRQIDIASHYGIRDSSVSRIKSGKRWAHVI